MVDVDDLIRCFRYVDSGSDPDPAGTVALLRAIFGPDQRVQWSRSEYRDLLDEVAVWERGG